MKPAAAVAALVACAPALAQEMAGMPSATAPSPGVVIPRVQLHGFWFEDDQFLLEESLRVEVGLARDLSVSAELPLYQGFLNAPRPEDGEFGFGDMDLLVELRILREDLNAIDTLRASVFAGAELPTGSDAFSQGSVDPCVGAVFSSIQGRHGLDVAGRYTLVTGDGMAHPIFISDTGDDFVNADLGYAYRVHPEAYGEERVAAWYLTVELNSVWTTGGEHEVLLSPGLLIEAPTYAVELGFGVPVSQDAVHAPELDFMLLAGLRLLF
ncbi:MAG: hypothetical protein RL325_617 [Planctomycetota bacterium]